ncbi:MAG: maleylpyruvate isomerase family mycothiol-dependent enzyme [Acidimicrobiales bacterium]
MTTQAVDALRSIHLQVGELISGFDEDDWARASGCEGWRVHEILAHMSSNMKQIADPDPAAAAVPDDAKAEEMMEQLVQPRRSWDHELLLREYRENFDGWIAGLEALQEEPVASTVTPMVDLGEYEMHMIANAYAFDHYCHLYVDLLRPSGPIEADLGEPTHEMVRPGIDWMIAGVPKMQPIEMPAAVSKPLRLVLTGPGGGTWTVLPASASGGIAVVEGADGDVVATITSSAHDFVSWGTKRSDWRSSCDVTGDTGAAEPFLDALNII